MIVVFTPEAEAQAVAMDTWWRANRPAAPTLFAEELAEARVLLAEAPFARSAHVTRRGRRFRRFLLPKTRNHVYFDVDEAASRVIVVAVWGAPKGKGPRL